MPHDSRRRIDRIAAQLQRRQPASEDHGPLLALAGLCAAASVAAATGKPTAPETLQRLRARLDPLSAAERASMLAEARRGLKAQSSPPDLPARLAELQGIAERLAM